MKFILGTKKKMTQIFREDGKVTPVTTVKANPCVITQLKNNAKDKYEALQAGCGNRKKISKPLKGHLKNVGLNCEFIRELRDYGEIDNLKVNSKFGVEIFSKGDIVDVKGVGKGKGFQGVVKRHGFAGSPASHGHKDQLRMPGSIGATAPAHVFKGKRMAGRMGGKSVTMKNLEIIDVDIENNLLYIKGALPGAINGLLEIKGEGLIKLREDVKKEEKKEEAQNKAEKINENESEVKDKTADNNEGITDTKEIKEAENKEENKEDKNMKEEINNKDNS